MGIPRLLVVGPRGEQITWLSAEHTGAAALKDWDFHTNQWPRTSSSSSSSSSSDDAAAAAADRQQQQHTYADPPSWPFTPEAAAAFLQQKQKHQ
ncbi:uncharacterized protein EMH_0074110 [Eimeria mitis]|uniref:Uncharacterized protein n=1 Tax=Eimeria mitis TaxID=44415 RepID=U6K626_9EIME|nr:uncharacterized protein EMH_0074110 [Eimeria mitis]CDJ32311.1 hypothetical protein, conserved [Eimeria mitis]